MPSWLVPLLSLVGVAGLMLGVPFAVLARDVRAGRQDPGLSPTGNPYPTRNSRPQPDN
ncbi:MAG: hypothetical protein GXX79_13235 [Actinomycetales bacterium]|nr:hypothetical protein [Actinomycetales bacterium]